MLPATPLPPLCDVTAASAAPVSRQAPRGDGGALCLRCDMGPVAVHGHTEIVFRDAGVSAFSHVVPMDEPIKINKYILVVNGLSSLVVLGKASHVSRVVPPRSRHLLRVCVTQASVCPGSSQSGVGVILRCMLWGWGGVVENPQERIPVRKPFRINRWNGARVESPFRHQTAGHFAAVSFCLLQLASDFP